MAEVTIRVDTSGIETKLQKKLKALVDDEQTKIGINEIIANAANNYIPRKSGELSSQKIVNSNTITWTAPYARYQYYGTVYAANRPIFNKERTTITGWYSQTPKYKTERELGIPGVLYDDDGNVLWEFGYTTAGTTHHWIDEMWKNDKRVINIRITNYLKRRVKEKGL